MQFMRRSLILAGVGALSTVAFGLAPPPAAAQSSEAAAVARAVDAFTKAMIAADRSALESLTDNALSYGHSAGAVETKAEFIEVVASKKTVYKSINLTDQSIAVSDNDAVVRHIFSAQVESGGQASSPRIGVMQVWRKQGDNWRLLARQAFRLA